MKNGGERERKWSAPLICFLLMRGNTRNTHTKKYIFMLARANGTNVNVKKGTMKIDDAKE